MCLLKGAGNKGLSAVDGWLRAPAVAGQQSKAQTDPFAVAGSFHLVAQHDLLPLHGSDTLGARFSRLLSPQIHTKNQQSVPPRTQ